METKEKKPRRAAGCILKKAYGKETLQSDRSIARICYQTINLNGIQYCRPHLLLSCHLCEETHYHVKSECDAERHRLGLRSGGDSGLNARSDRWHEEITAKQLEARFGLERLQREHGNPIPPRIFHQHMTECKLGERQINDRFLADVTETMQRGASQCCYWGCSNPDAVKLFKCKGCGIAKYCSKDHQAADWKWEHKWECTRSVPQFFLDEIESDRQRNLAGDYDKVER